tara:strand:+ start:114 stop:410 length:297 start_codon:yes stop_codon:yes gene_type:complete
MCQRFINDFVEKVIEKTKNPLKLYKVEFEGEYVFITANYTEDEARNMAAKHMLRFYSWIVDGNANRIVTTEIGVALENVAPGIVHHDGVTDEDSWDSI